jgi:hypothetical protein
VVVGGVPRLQIALNTIAPRVSELYAERAMWKAQQSSEPPRSKDSLYAPSGQDYGRRRSRDRAAMMQSSTYTRAVVSDAMRAAPLVLAGAAVAAVVAARR